MWVLRIILRLSDLVSSTFTLAILPTLRALQRHALWYTAGRTEGIKELKQEDPRRLELNKGQKLIKGRALGCVSGLKALPTQ